MSRRCAPCVVIILVTGLIAAIAVAKPEKVVFSNAGASVNQPCQGGDVDINGASGTYVLTGDCGTVAVNGATNTIYLEAAAKIRVTGAGNKVVWVRGAGKAKKPNIKNTGVGNQVAQGALPGDAVTTGSGNGSAIQVGGVGINVPAIGSGTTSGGPAVAAANNAAAATETISVVDNGQQITRACHGQDVSVTGNENQITLSGDCGNLSVTGNENQVTIEAAYEIAVSGNDNTIIYRRGVKAKKPRLNNLGNDNSVRQSE